MAPYFLFIGLAVFCMGILNTYNIFALPAVTPAILNICMIIGTLIISPRLEQPVIGLAIGVVVGGILQFVIQIPAIFRCGFKFIPSIDWKNAEL